MFIADRFNIKIIVEFLNRMFVSFFSIIVGRQTKRPAPTAHIRELLTILPRRGRNAYHSFLKALDETENTDAAEYLREHDGSKNTTGDTQEEKQQYTEQPEEKHKLQSQNKQGMTNFKIRFDNV